MKKLMLILFQPKKAIYNIRSNRNLDSLLDIWTGLILPKDKNLEFHITPNLIEYSDKLKNTIFFLEPLA